MSQDKPLLEKENFPETMNDLQGVLKQAWGNDEIPIRISKNELSCIFFIDDIRILLKMVDVKKLSVSRFCELLNVMAYLAGRAEGASSSVNGGVWVKASEEWPENIKSNVWRYTNKMQAPMNDIEYVFNNRDKYPHLSENIEWYCEFRPSLPKDNEGDKERAEEYANKIVPNSDKNDAPYFTSSDRWQDNKDAFLAGCQSKEARIKELEDALHKIVVKQYPGGETEAPYWVDYAISIAHSY